jgi:hypothetical protein
MFESLSRCDNSVIAWAAEQAAMLEKQHQQGELSDKEYVELLQDLARNQKITALAGDLEQKILWERALTAAITLAGAFK